ncbi:transcription factor NF-E2 45 kDa subunit-like [Carcharodon carcharias]|uniref:transcription factor NF-E2 45 kDa subunit-like n=1 Tax=Carcharodon carcharias TaxID=13397 RepID=UPI001B7E17CD|nr:transcription factor NF-E2 45 kDa subunit-like [Carcharodon carcharias]
MSSAHCILPFTRDSTEQLSVHHPHLPELGPDPIYRLPMAPCSSQYDNPLPHLTPQFGVCGEQGQQSEAEMTWQELMSLAELQLQGLDTDGEMAADPTFYGGPAYPLPPPPPPPPMDPYCLSGPPAQAWHGHAGTPAPGVYALPVYEGGPRAPGFEGGCCLALGDRPTDRPSEAGCCERGSDGGSDSGLSLDSSPNAGSEGWGAAPSLRGCPWGHGGLALPPLPLPQPQLQLQLQLQQQQQQRPVSRGKRDSSNRDERRAQALRIPLATEAMVNLPVDDFNELVSRHRLSEQQLTLARDIRRRGKNKVAAQNCRQRKLENIARLERDLLALRLERERLAGEREEVGAQLRRAERRVGELSRRVFAALRDPRGLPYSPEEFSLQQAADGGVYLVRCVAGGQEEGQGANLLDTSTCEEKRRKIWVHPGPFASSGRPKQWHRQQSTFNLASPLVVQLPFQVVLVERCVTGKAG